MNKADYAKVMQKHHEFQFGPRDSRNMIEYEDVGGTAHDVGERLDENIEQKAKMGVTLSLAQIYHHLKTTQEKRHQMENKVEEMAVIWVQG